MVYRVVGSDAGSYTDVRDNYYVKGTMVEMAPIGFNTSLAFESLTDASVFTALDFENVWVMGDVCPVLKTFADEEITVAAPVNVGALIPNIPGLNDETTAVETAAVETTAPVTEEAGSFPVAIVVIAVALVAVVAVVVVIVAKKKK